MLEQTRLEGDQLLRGAALGRGVAQSCNTAVPTGRGGEASVGVLQLLVMEEKRTARATLK